MTGGQIAALICAILLLLPGGCFLVFGIGFATDENRQFSDAAPLLLGVAGAILALGAGEAFSGFIVSSGITLETLGGGFTSATTIAPSTARAAETDRIVGLELGANDYIVKPFFVREVIARIKVQLRKPGKAGVLTTATTPSRSAITSRLPGPSCAGPRSN